MITKNYVPCYTGKWIYHSIFLSWVFPMSVIRISDIGNSADFPISVNQIDFPISVIRLVYTSMTGDRRHRIRNLLHAQRGVGVWCVHKRFITLNIHNIWPLSVSCQIVFVTGFINPLERNWNAHIFLKYTRIITLLQTLCRHAQRLNIIWFPLTLTNTEVE